VKFLANDDAAIAALTYIAASINVEDGCKKMPSMPQNLLPSPVTQVCTLRQMWIYRNDQLDPILNWTTITWTDYVTFSRTILPLYGGKIPASVLPLQFKTKSLMSHS